MPTAALWLNFCAEISPLTRLNDAPGHWASGFICILDGYHHCPIHKEALKWNSLGLSWDHWMTVHTSDSKLGRVTREDVQNLLS